MGQDESWKTGGDVESERRYPRGKDSNSAPAPGSENQEKGLYRWRRLGVDGRSSAIPVEGKEATLEGGRGFIGKADIDE